MNRWIMSRILIVSLFNFVVFLENEIHADTKCSEHALEFSKSPDSLTPVSLGDLRTCIVGVMKTKNTDDKSKGKTIQDVLKDMQNHPSQLVMSCSDLALNFSKTPSSLPSTSLEKLMGCVETILSKKFDDRSRHKVWTPPINKGGDV